MAGMFGAPNGWMALTQQGLQQAQTQRTQAETLHQLADIPRVQAAAQLEQAQAERTQMQTAREKQMIQLLTQQAERSNTPQDPVQRLTDLGTRLSGAGFIEQGSKILNEASMMNYRQAAQRHMAAQTLIAQQNQKLKKMKDLTTFLGNATDEASFNQGKMAFLAEYPDEQIPPQLQKYNPALVQALHNKALTAYQAADLEYKKLKDKELQDYRKTEEARKERQHQETLAQQKILTKYREDRADARKKTVGPKAPRIPGDPKGSTIQAADALIREYHPNLDADMTVGKEKVSSAAYDLAADAAALRANNPGMSPTEAMHKVLVDMEKEGKFKEADIPKPGWLSFGKTQHITTYTRGRNPTLSIPKPPPSRDPKDFVDGQTYIGPKGAFRWDAKKQKAIMLPGEANRNAADAAVR